MADTVTSTPLSTGVVPAAASGVSPYTSTSTISPYAQGYVSDMLSTAQTLADKTYTPYAKDLVAGESDLQSRAFKGLAGLSMPSTAYTPTTFTNQFTAPVASEATKFEGYYTAPTLSEATKFTNQFAAPANKYTPTEFTTGAWTTQEAQRYMNPYLEAALAPQTIAAKREAELKRIADAARLTQAGAYGGSRQAIMESEGARNLAENLANITGTGYKSAYDTALQQWNVEQGRGLDVQKAADASRQFGAQQALTTAQLEAQYGLAALQAQEVARQYNQTQQMTAAQLEAQYGLSADQATELARQYNQTQLMTGAQLGAQYGLAAQQAQESANQFKSKYGLEALQAGQNLAKMQADLGAQQREIAQQKLTSDYQQWQNQQKFPYEQLQFQQSMLQGLPLTTQQVTRPELSTAEKIAATGNQLLSAFDWAKNAGIVDKNLNMADFAKQVFTKGWDWLTGQSSGAQAIENPAQPGQEGYGWQYFDNGTAISPEGWYYHQGELVWVPEDTTAPSADDFYIPTESEYWGYSVPDFSYSGEASPFTDW